MYTYDHLFLCLQGKSIPQGATIVKLVTTQAGTTGKQTAIVTSQHQAGQQAATNVIGVSSMQQVHIMSCIGLPPFCNFSVVLVKVCPEGCKARNTFSNFHEY